MSVKWADRGKRRITVTQQQARAGWTFAIPALLVIGAVTIFPIVFSVIMSLSHVSLGSTGFALKGMTTHNYQVVFASPEYRHAVMFTIVYTIITVLVEVVLGTAAALVLEKLAGGRGWMLALLLVPWSIVTVISAELWAYIYNGIYGVLDVIVHPLLGTSPLWLGYPVSATISMMVADIWKTTPFVTVIVLAGLVMLPRELFEAAEVDGASGWSAFWRITLPMLRSTISVAVLFRMLQAFGLFDLPFVLTSGGPGYSTEPLALFGYKVMFSYLDFGPGAAIAASTTAIVLVLSLLFLKVFKAQVGKESIA
ncbi:MAG: carbohydrate ABC transporter permease [Acidimicrobiales bacterium]